MKTWMKPLALGAVVALATGACESGTDPEIFDDSALVADAALIAADGMFQDLALMQNAAVWGGFGAGAPEAVGVEVEGTTSFTRTVTFTPCNGGPEDRYDPLLTASMNIVTSHTRSVTHTFWTADVQRNRNMTVSGLCGEEATRIWNGTASGVVDKSRFRDETTRNYDATTSATFTNVTRQLPRSQNPYPVAGSIERTVNAVLTDEDGNILRQKNVTFTISFDGTNLATLQDVATGETWQVDLSLRGVKGRLNKKP
jgi:hypothetical protein